MKVVTKNEIDGFPIEKITKLILNKTMESETLVEGIIINKDNVKVYLQGTENKGKGRPLITKKLVEGVLQVILDKNNYDMLVEANYEFTQNYKVQGLEVKDLYKFISKYQDKYLVEI